MVVPTMLARVVEHLGGESAGAPKLASLAYGGARMAQPVLERALVAFPDTGFVNAYGLTETSSTIAVLGPDDHREALSDPALRHRLSSVGRVVPGMEAQIRAEDDITVLADGDTGLLWVRGAQVSGEYMGKARYSTPTAGSPPATALGSRTSSCSSVAARTTRSSAVARTSHPPRSRMSSSATTMFVRSP